jgi:hypothetical protein
MMSNTNTGGPAFPSLPIVKEFEGKRLTMTEGLTMRDYFAAKALPAIYKDACECARVDGWPEGWRDEVAAEAYEVADAVLKARDAS